MRMVDSASICSLMRWMRTHLPDQRQGDGRAQHPDRSEFNQYEIQLQAQHHAGEKCDQHNNLYGFGTDKIDLLDNVRDGFDPENHEKGPEEKYGHRPQIVVQSECFTTEKIKKGLQSAFFGNKRFILGSGLNRRIVCHFVISSSSDDGFAGDVINPANSGFEVYVVGRFLIIA
jgi:hypothetical protein